MARFIYEWKPTQHGRRLFRRPVVRAVESTETATVEPAPVAYSSLKKDELIDLADERGEDTTGTKADIIARLEQSDD